MKKLFRISLLLWLAANATAQESPAQNPPKVLRTYDWKDLNVQQKLPGSEIISMNGISTLKIQLTNSAALEVSLLIITNPSIIKNAHQISFDMKYENVALTSGMTPPDFSEFSRIFPPRAIGGDNITNQSYFTINGTLNPTWSNWEPHQFTVKVPGQQIFPTQLELKFYLAGSGTFYLRPIKLLGTAESSNWWTPEQGGMIGGIAGSIIGCFGVLIGVLASKGNARKFVLALTKSFIVLGIFLLLAGAVAAATKQPYAVYYPLLLAGFILAIVFSVNLPSIQRRYDELEIRRMTSVDTMGS
jgi:hypothetical protein